MKLDELREHCLKTLKHTQKFPTKTFEEHALVLLLIENQTSVIEELEKIKEKIAQIDKIFYPDLNFNNTGDCYVDRKLVADVINDRIAELKGENNDS